MNLCPISGSWQTSRDVNEGPASLTPHVLALGLCSDRVATISCHATDPGKCRKNGRGSCGQPPMAGIGCRSGADGVAFVLSPGTHMVPVSRAAALPSGIAGFYK